MTTPSVARRRVARPVRAGERARAAFHRAVGGAPATTRRVVRTAGRATLVLLVLYVAAYGMRYVVLGRWAWIPMLAPSFERRPVAITLHALGGSLVLLIGLWQLQPGRRARRPALHRALGWLYAVAALLTGAAGVYMAAYSVGGWVTHLGFGLLGLGTLGATARATRLAVVRDLPAHRRWMVRSYALMLAAVALRLELPLLTAAFGATLGYQLVSWTCWVPHVLWTEWWLRRASPGRRAVPGAAQRGGA
jgi:uncharacterized membrane protein